MSKAAAIEARIGTGRLFAVFALALSLRVSVLLEISDSPLTEVLLGDSGGYVDWAREIAGGSWRGSDVFYQAPLYPYFLGVLFSTVGPGLEAVRWAQILLGASACVLIALATARFLAPRAGLVAGVLLAVYPLAIFFDVIIQKTSVALFLFALLLFLLSRFERTQEIRWPLLAGVALAGLILTRENALILLPCIALWSVLPGSGGTHVERAIRLGLLLAGAATILVPVGARNLAMGDQFLITTSQLGPNLYIGNNPEADGRYRPLLPNRGDVRHERHDARRLAEEALGRSLSPGEVSQYWVARTLDFMREQPLAWLRLLAHKVYMVVNATEIPDTESVEAYADESWVLAVLVRVFHFGVLFPIAVLGIWTSRARARELFPLYLMGFAMAASVAGFFVMARYRFPLVALLVMFAGAGLASLHARWRDGTRESWTAGWLALGAAALVSNLPLGAEQEPRALNYYNVAMAMIREERFEEAQASLERAAETSQATNVLLTLGSVLERRGLFEEAAAHYEDLLDPPRANPRELHARLARVYRELGREEDAVRHDPPAPTQAPTPTDSN